MHSFIGIILFCFGGIILSCVWGLLVVVGEQMIFFFSSRFYENVINFRGRVLGRGLLLAIAGVENNSFPVGFNFSIK